MSDDSAAYIVDTYNPYSNNENVVYVFLLHGYYFCIRKVTDFEWGQPVLQDRSIEDGEQSYYCVYSTFEDAMDYVLSLRGLH